MAIGLQAGPKSWLGRIGAFLLLIAFAGLIVTALFPTNLETAPPTQTGNIHTISLLVNVASIFISTLCLAFSYGGSLDWRQHRTPALIFAGLLAFAFVAQFMTLHRGAPYGITNRLFVAVLRTWLISNSLCLRVVTGRRHQSES
ncbi:hypothetical protein ABENE_20795 [Asticcacaulis benevestitus DSM 16100 = ATCC BAA-896]|uniref:DUF998 domain-containing protein n=1 Tax=Asticcacaulis benevestitus DSM 16100 = ATCC BAA-896 TaxID=1121022 RepID=V4P3W0_9CAUL|nr:hypothetical protein ABENE_20795 [Asticcacaulis benevestitus DSM 16100 = ATCC BAA-896]